MHLSIYPEADSGYSTRCSKLIKCDFLLKSGIVDGKSANEFCQKMNDAERRNTYCSRGCLCNEFLLCMIYLSDDLCLKARLLFAKVLIPGAKESGEYSSSRSVTTRSMLIIVVYKAPSTGSASCDGNDLHQSLTRIIPEQ